jgi:hypothetical protein
MALPLEAFHLFNGRRNSASCKDCVSKIRRGIYEKNPKLAIFKNLVWRKENPDKASKVAHKNRLKTTYKMFVEDYDRLLEEQDGCCAICKRPEYKIRLSVDHNHDTGKIRGLLCHKCNTSLGLMEENEEAIKGMLEYLKRDK